MNLKKQSQFDLDLMGVTPFMNRGYGNKRAVGGDENKANPPELSMPTRNRRTSQSQFNALEQIKGTSKGGKMFASANPLTG
jgi:hypothetical protein